MPYIREPILTPVSIEELHPTQITVGMREVEGDASGQRQGFGDIPELVARLQDDPFRSLAGELRRDAVVECHGHFPAL
jgi:hypothetical protein